MQTRIIGLEDEQTDHHHPPTHGHNFFDPFQVVEFEWVICPHNSP